MNIKKIDITKLTCSKCNIIYDSSNHYLECPHNLVTTKFDLKFHAIYNSIEEAVEDIKNET